MKTNSSSNLLGSLSNIDGKQKKGRRNFPGGANQPKLAAQGHTPAGHARPGGARRAWKGQVDPTCPHGHRMAQAPLREGRGL
jgi:hypothetical protein